MAWGDVITKTPTTRLPPHCPHSVPRDELLLAPSVPYPILTHWKRMTGLHTNRNPDQIDIRLLPSNDVCKETVKYFYSSNVDLQCCVNLCCTAKCLSYTYVCVCVCVCVCSCCLVAKSCPTLCNSVDHSPSGSSVHGISQARILE